MKIVCNTLFDCSVTGITGHYKSSQIPFEDQAGHTITDLTTWHRARNQQRNWETLLQIVGLRTQPQDIEYPTCKDGVWQFSFTVEADGVFGITNSSNPLAGLEHDCNNVPMVVDLDERDGLHPALQTQGENQNIWFTINNVQEQ
jgi:hypothetical protein